MNYEVKWSPKAAKNLSSLPKELIERVLNKFDLVKEEPFRFLEYFDDKILYKLRIGDYRALIDVDSENKTLLVQVFDKRGRVYKR